jgi:hypothetical protein
MLTFDWPCRVSAASMLVLRQHLMRSKYSSVDLNQIKILRRQYPSSHFGSSYFFLFLIAFHCRQRWLTIVTVSLRIMYHRRQQLRLIFHRVICSMRQSYLTTKIAHLSSTPLRFVLQCYMNEMLLLSVMFILLYNFLTIQSTS